MTECKGLLRRGCFAASTACYKMECDVEVSSCVRLSD